LGARAFAFSINVACCFASSSGGGVVRVATGDSELKEKLVEAAGEQTHSRRTGCRRRIVELVRRIGRNIDRSPPHADSAAERGFELPSSRMNVLFEVHAGAAEGPPPADVLCSPAASTSFSFKLGVPSPPAPTPPPELDAKTAGYVYGEAKALAPKYRTEFLGKA